MSTTYKWIVIIAVILALGGTFYYKINQTNENPEVGAIKIGALFAQTGPAAKYGQISMLGVTDAIEYFKTKNPKVEVSLITEDSQGDAAKATIAATKMINIDQVNFVVLGTSAVSAAVAPIAEQNKKVFITDASLYGLTKNKNFIFQNFMPALGGISTKINQTGDWKKVAIIYINDEFGQMWSSRIKESLNSNKESAIFSFEKTSTDFKTDALKIKKFNPDTIVVIGYGPALNQVFADLKLNKVEKPLVGYLDCTLPGVLSDSRFNLEKQYSYEYPKILNKDMETWINSKGRELNTFYTLAFDNTLLALNSAKDSNNDPEKAASLLREKDYESLWGKASFSGNNSFERDLVLTQINSGVCTPVEN